MSDKNFRAEILKTARSMLLKKDVDGSHQNAVVELVAGTFDVSYVDAVDLILSNEIEVESTDPETDYTILVAFEVLGDTFEKAQRDLMTLLPKPDRNVNNIECWWIAEDERYDGSDNDSAEFVPGSGVRAWTRMHPFEDRTCGNPECPQAGRCGGACVATFVPKFRTKIHPESI